MTDRDAPAGRPPDGTPRSGRNAAGRFVPGFSGNPAGRQRAALAAEMDARGTVDAPAVYEAVLAAACGGDMRAAALLLDRWWPVVKRTPLDLPDLPRLETAEDLVRAHAGIIERAGRNGISAEQAEVAAKLIEVHRKLIELTEVQTKLAAIERILAGTGRYEVMGGAVTC